MRSGIRPRGRARQLTDNPVPHRRIELQGPHEHLRILHRPASAGPDPTDHQEVAT